jgi:FkbH-like protein
LRPATINALEDTCARFPTHRPSQSTDAKEAKTISSMSNPLNEPIKPESTGQAVAVAATFAYGPLVPLLRDALEQIEVPHTVLAAPYGQVVEQFLAAGSAFAVNSAGINVTLVRIGDWTAGADGDAAALVDDFAAAVRAFADSTAALTVVAVCPEPADRRRPELSERLVAALRETPQVATVQVDDWLAAQGCAGADDAESAAIAHIPYSDEAFAVIAIGVARVVASVVARPKKVIAVDCDYTLWGGACGDVEPAELELSGRHLAVQRFLKDKHDAGFLLALCSRNDSESVERVFRDRAPDMVLTRGHFVAARVNWQPKWMNIASLAEELRLGRDSFVLVDDDAYVCAETAGALPEVTVVQVPVDDDASVILAETWELDRFFPTREDRLRNDTYRADARRAAIAETADAASLNEQLGTVIEVRRAEPPESGRIAQLVARTNQFNFAAADVAIVRAMLSAGATGWVATLRDRFGDYGTIAVAVTTEEPESMCVECFAMSCRVLDRGVAEALFGEIWAAAAAAGKDKVFIPFRLTGRNSVAHDFLRSQAEAKSSHESPVLEIVDANPLRNRHEAAGLARMTA